MKKWSVTSAAADFDAFWDEVKNEGPQILRRRGVDFVFATRDDLEARMGRKYEFSADSTHEFPELNAEPHS
jgi:hypothetical protein